MLVAVGRTGDTIKVSLMGLIWIRQAYKGYDATQPE